MREFYRSYSQFKKYTTPDITHKHIKRFDGEIWRPARMRPGLSAIDLGCGTGLQLAYLREKGLQDLSGIEFDEKAVAAAPATVRDAIQVMDIDAFVATNQRTFDRIFLFDVLEHFEKKAARELLIALRGFLAPDGMIVTKTPNAASPWGGQFQHGDLTHLTAFTPDSMRQMALSAGLQMDHAWGQPLGSPSRQRRNRLAHRLLSWMISSPPEIWDGNFYAALSQR